MCTWQSIGLYLGCNVGEKRWTNILGYVELKSMKAMEQPSIDQNENEDYQHSNLK